MKKFALFLIALASSLCMSLSTAATADKVTYVYTDPAGSPLVLTDAAGTVTSQYRYEPFGEQAVINVGSTTATAIGFAGKRLDPASDLQYSIARHYDRRVGRFVSLDPVDPIEGDPHTFNRYAYANNNPYLYVDPDGNIPLLIPVAIFIAKEVAAELASEATDGWSDYLSVRRLGTKAVRYAVKQGAKYVAANAGRAGKQAKLRELADDDKLGSADRGWLKQEINAIERGKRSSIRNPPGKDLAHERGREAAKGYGYQHSNLQDRDLHRLQHKYDDFGRKNKERPMDE